MAAELLQYVVNDALHQGYLKLPLAQPKNDFSIVQYADDTILIMEADVNQLLHLKGFCKALPPPLVCWLITVNEA